MRKDIEIHINTEDFVLQSKNRFKIYPFSWVERPENQLERYIYGEVEVPDYVLENSIKQNGLYIEIPYTPVYKEIMIRIKRVIDDTQYSYMVNPANGSEWFLVTVAKYGVNPENVYASELKMVSDGGFYLSFNRDHFQIFSAQQSDFHIVKAGRQNGNLLLKCVPTNNYRYPLSGVGLIRWTNSNIDTSTLAEVLKREFLEDGVTIQNAKYDYESKQLYIDGDVTLTDE